MTDDALVPPRPDPIQAEADRLLLGIDLDDGEDAERGRLRMLAYMQQTEAITERARLRIEATGNDRNDPETWRLLHIARHRSEVTAAVQRAFIVGLDIDLDRDDEPEIRPNPEPEPGA